MIALSPSETDLLPLLDHLAATVPRAAEIWGAWAIQPVGGAGNNRLYRAAGPVGAFAVKFTIRDARDRAGREYETLTLLRALGRDLAARPVLLDRDRYPQPVNVQTWLDGVVSAAPPASDAEWGSLVAHYAAVHTITPQHAPMPLRPAVVAVTDGAAGRAHIRQQLDHLPAAAWPATLGPLVRQADAVALPTWPQPHLTLCRCDPNIRNFIRREGEWASVDWENSGWGDPAFEIGDLLAHPAYAVISPSRWTWVAETYAALRKAAGVIARIQTYYLLMLVWWAARLARSLYEIPAGRDQRLVERPADWNADLQAKYDAYVQRATAALDTWAAGAKSL